MTSNKFVRVYTDLFRYLGPQHWWPGDGALEIITGAILTQNTAWTNVEKAITELKARGCLTMIALRDIPEISLGRYIRSSGYFRLKAKRLKSFVGYVWKNYNGRLDLMFKTPVARLREELLSVSGIGPETADSILLYAGDKPVFVVDAYTKRIMVRHGWAKAEDSYDDISEKFTRALPNRPSVFNEYHALFVRLGKYFCLKKNPRCRFCPLCSYLPRQRKPQTSVGG